VHVTVRDGTVAGRDAVSCDDGDGEVEPPHAIAAAVRITDVRRFMLESSCKNRASRPARRDR